MGVDDLRTTDRGPEPEGILLLLRVWLDDRPGALGLVASRIGAMRGDIIGVDVLERLGNAVVDEFAVALPFGDHGLVDLLVREVEEVDGVSVEEWRTVERFPDPRLDALISADRLCSCATVEEVLSVLVRDAHDEFHPDWTAIVRDGLVVATAGDLPVDDLDAVDDPPGAVEPPHAAVLAAEPGEDVALAELPGGRARLVAARIGHPFRRRERKQLTALADIADRVLLLLERRR